jgi:hypothetical protein
MHPRNGPIGVLALVCAALLTVLAPSAAAAAGSDTRRPSTPTDLHAQRLGFMDVTLAWNPSTDDSGWLLYEVEVQAPTYLQRYSALDSTKTFTGLPQGTTFKATVVAVDGARNRSAAVSIQFTTPIDTTTPSAPANLRPIVNDGILTAVTWIPVTDNTPIVYRLLAEGSVVFATTGTRANVSDFLGALGVLNPGTTHTFTVRALDATDHMSPPSNAITVTLPG